VAKATTYKDSRVTIQTLKPIDSLGLTAGLKSLCENCKIDTAAAEDALI